MLGENMGTLRLYELLRKVQKHIGRASESFGILQPPRAYFFFGRTFDSYAHAQCHTLCVLRPLRRGAVNMIEHNDCQEDCS